MFSLQDSACSCTPFVPRSEAQERLSLWLAAQVLTQLEYLAARREGSLVKHADGSWGPFGGGEPELPLSRPLKRARYDVSTAAGGALPETAKPKGQQGRRCAIM